MTPRRTRGVRLLAAALASVALVSAIVGCAGERSVRMPQPGARDAAPSSMRIGFVPSADVLPLWVAELDMFDKVGLSAKLVTYPNKAAVEKAFANGEVDAFVGDIIEVAKLNDAGHRNRIVTICLGTLPGQGRVGVVAPRRSGIHLLSQAAKRPIATSVGSLDEFVLDGLASQAATPFAVRTRDIEDPRQRLDMVLDGTVSSAVLGEPYMTTAVAKGARFVASDGKGLNLSQSVISVSDTFLSKPGGTAAVDRLLGAWDLAASSVNSHRPLYRVLLLKKMRPVLPSIRTVRMSNYPHHELPSEAQVEIVLAWMHRKGLLKSTLDAHQITWKLRQGSS